jgi:hypothetical protein
MLMRSRMRTFADVGRTDPNQPNARTPTLTVARC